MDERRLQLPNTLALVSDGDLASFERRREAERLARLLADQDLIDALQWHGFEGEGWEKLAEALAEYGVAVMSAWLATGAIVRKCREKALRGVLPLPARGLCDDEVDELASLVVGEALHSFRENVLKKHRWDSRKGAALKTYFVGHCCIVYVSVYRQWRREERPTSQARERESVFELDPAAGASRRQALSPESAALGREAAMDAMAVMLSNETQQIFLLKSRGYAEDEIAEILQMTLPQVKSRVYTHRKKVRRTAS